MAMKNGETCSCPHHTIIPILVILFGLAFLLQALGVVSEYFTGVAWPILVILAGLQKLFGSRCKCC